MKSDSSSQRHTNQLISESSPYLQQHAHNPVDWYPWGEIALEKAKKEDKPILVSIGYSACHWCHVMEHESFENEALAELMNNYFVCIKVDREERPDIDDIYMNAVQLMGQQGGWPLNVFLTPEQKPFWGGTYFPPSSWESIIHQLHVAFTEKRGKIEDTANRLTEGINASQLFSDPVEAKQKISDEELQSGFESIAKRYDAQNGGMGSAPKFPMPAIYHYLLSYASISKNGVAKEIVFNTLNKMSLGGIYDQIGGGFARYATDDRWLIPHFEKMLYDNAQLIQLYSEAYRIHANPIYKDVVFETIDFCKRELYGIDGNFYCALDADSEGIEGKFYVWQYDDLLSLLGDKFDLFCTYYNVHPEGNWEGNIILERNQREIIVRDEHLLKSCKSILLQNRENRIRPGLDDKTLTAWNGLMLKGLCEAYKTFGEENHLTLAKEISNFIKTKMTEENGKLYRNYKNGSVNIDGFLEDYATVMNGYIALYQVTFDESWIEESQKLMDYVFANFHDPIDGMFFFTDQNSTELIARKKEVQDNVIPSSNSIMARNLLHLGILTDNSVYKTIATSMSQKMKKVTLQQTSFMANWATLLAELRSPNAEVVIIGKDYDQFRRTLQSNAPSSAIFMGGPTSGNLPLMKGKKPLPEETIIYVCRNNTCSLPTSNINQALKQLVL